MAHHRKVDCRIWNDEKFRGLSERGKFVFLFEMTHPNLTMLGAMRATVPGLAAELEMDQEAFSEAFRESIAKGMVRHDATALFVWLPNFLRYNRPESPNVVKAWPHAYDLLPECALKLELLEGLKAFVNGLSKGFQEAFAEGFREHLTKGMPNQEQEQECQEQEREARERAPFPVPTNSGSDGEFMLAAELLRECKLSTGPSDIRAVAEQIGYEAQERGGTLEAAEFIKVQAKAAIERGERVTIFWFKDRKFAETDVYAAFLAKETGDLHEHQ